MKCLDKKPNVRENERTANSDVGVLRRLRQGAYLVGGSIILVTGIAGCSNQITNPTEQAPATGQIWAGSYNPALPFAQQTVTDSIRSGKIFLEVSNFDAPIQVSTDASGNILGLPAGRYRARVLGGDYILASVGSDRIIFAKESGSGILNQGESLPIDSLKFRLDDLTNGSTGAAAAISILDANGNILKSDLIPGGQTRVYSIGGKTYAFHVYTVAPGYTFGVKWAEVGIFSAMNQAETGAPYVAADSSAYTFSMSWNGNQLQSWQFRATQ